MKYELIKNDTKKLPDGTVLYRIVALIDFSTIHSTVRKGDKGGYIEKEDNLSQSDSDLAWVFGKACVFGDARVYGNACVFGEARVFGDAWVFGKACVFGKARVFGEACVFGEARVFGKACVFGNACVFGEARVSEEISENKW